MKTGEGPSGAPAWKQIVIHWRRDHVVHHSTSGELDRRGIGDIWTLTVREDLESSRARRLSYRLIFRLWDEKRHRLVGFGHLRNPRRGNTL